MKRTLWFACLFACLAAVAWGQSLPWPGPGGAGCSGCPTLIYNGSASQTTGGGFISGGATYTAFPVGPAAANRTVLVMAVFRHGPVSPEVINSVTIGGISASNVAQTFNSAGANYTLMYMWVANVPTGTTANIVVTYSASIDRADGVQVWSAYGLSSTTPVASASSLSTTVSPLSLNVSAGGIVVASTWSFTPVVSPPCAWAGVTANGDILTDPSGAQLMSAASANFVPAASPRTVSCTYNATSGFEPAALSVSFR